MKMKGGKAVKWRGFWSRGNAAEGGGIAHVFIAGIARRESWVESNACRTAVKSAYQESQTADLMSVPRWRTPSGNDAPRVRAVSIFLLVNRKVLDDLRDGGDGKEGDDSLEGIHV